MVLLMFFFLINKRTYQRAYEASETGQRNTTVYLEMEQQHHYSPLGSFPQQQPVANVANLEAHHSLLQDNSAMLYGLPQYHQHHPTNYYVAFQAQPPSQLPASSSHGVSSDHFMDHTRGTYKRKNAEGIHMNLTTLAAPFGSARNIPGDVLPPPLHAPISFIQGNYAAHPLPGSIWYDHHHGRSDGPPSFWPHPPYMHGNYQPNQRMISFFKSVLDCVIILSIYLSL